MSLRCDSPAGGKGTRLAAPAHANDLWVDASAIQFEAWLLSADAIFGGTPGLTLLQ
jgi:hypothetical protein